MRATLSRYHLLYRPLTLHHLHSPSHRHFSHPTSPLMAPKRRATSPVRPPAAKKHQVNSPPNHPTPPSKEHAPDDDDNPVPIAERLGIVNRTFYPAEMDASRCEKYNTNTLPRPMDVLNSTIADTRSARAKIRPGECVVHWFKRDLRLYDNRALAQASAKARSAGVPLIALFVVSPQDYQAHLTSPARVDFELRTLEILGRDLGGKDIPLVVEMVEERKGVPGWIVSRCKEWGARHVFCNVEYEVDELRREAKLTRMCLEAGIDFTVVHDDVVVTPGELQSGAGKQYSVYSPWYKAWAKKLADHPRLLDAAEPPTQNPKHARERFKELFDRPIPLAPKNKSLTDEERDRFAHLWPAGEHEAQNRLDLFLREKGKQYKDNRNLPGANGTAMLSVHFATGTLAARTAVRKALEANGVKRVDAGSPGFSTWISEIGWRDFYKHVLVHWPYVCMFKPFKYEYANLEWSYNMDHFKHWCEGTTGYPIVDAAMRQMNYMAYMHNRCRMIVASFLTKDLLLDWRMGEKYFMEHFVDGDFASNNGGWGFGASCGVDPQPYFRVFNPLLQSEKFDPDGTYIRKWVPELKGIKGSAIHDPYGRGHAKEAEKAGYPRPIVEHKVQRDKALEMYKSGLGRSTANVGGGVHN